MEKNSQEQIMDQYWDERSDSYSEMNMNQFHSDRKRVWEEAIFSHVDETKKLKILDIGTGPGFFAILSALRGHEVTGADMNGEMLKKARENAAQSGVFVNFVQVGRKLPFAEESFDLIISRDVTWTLTEPEEQLKSWMSLLKKGGKMMYFDAEWNYHHKSRESFEDWERRKAAIKKQGIEFYAKAEEMERIAADLPMTYKDRPAWDRKFWEAQGHSCRISENLNQQLFNREEQIHYQAHPVFLVEVWK